MSERVYLATCNSEGKISPSQIEGGGGGGESSRWVVKTPEEFGAKHEAGKDDAKAITEAIEAAVAAGIANGSYYAEVLFESKVYYAERNPVEGGTTKGNAQIPLPIISPETQQKFTLVLRGVLDATAGPHWHQEVNQMSGTVINSTLATGSSGTWGAPSVLGGPTKYTDPKGGLAFSNMLLVTDGLTITQQKNPVVIGCDSRQLACHNVIKLATMVRATPAELAASLPTNELGIGLYLPLAGNNDDNNIDWYTSYGHYTSLVASEHLVANRIAQVYGNKGIIIVGLSNEGTGPELRNAAQHGGVINYLSSEVMKSCHLEAVGLAEHSRYPIIIHMLSCESGEGTYDIVDPENVLLGQINWENTNGGAGAGTNARINGAKRLKVINLYNEPGKVGPPTYKSTETLTNPYQRDAFVTLEKVTAVEVDGQAQAVTGECSFVEVPSNKTIKATGVSGKWFWTLR